MEQNKKARPNCTKGRGEGATHPKHQVGKSDSGTGHKFRIDSQSGTRETRNDRSSLE